MISGAAVTYLFVAIIYNVFLTHSNNPSVECARGAALGLLALISGALLGTAGASTFAVTHPLCKGGAK